jgi:hypothetical protein
VIEVPLGIAPAGTTDPAKQVGLILCFQEQGHLQTLDTRRARTKLLAIMTVKGSGVALLSHCRRPIFSHLSSPVQGREGPVLRGLFIS